MNKLYQTMLMLGLCASFVGCGGGGGGGNVAQTTPPATTTPPPAGQCSVADENQSVLTYLQDEYYWYKDIPAGLNPASYATPQDLLNAAKAPQDRFSFIITVEQYNSIFTQANFVGMGFSQQVAADEKTLEVRYVYDNGAAFDAGMTRGDKIIAIDGTDTEVLIAQVKAGTTSWSDIFGGNEAGVSVNITFNKPSGDSITSDFVKNTVDTNTVMATKVLAGLNNRQVGYMVFDQFIGRSANDLNEAFEQLSTANVDELVLDLRYNGGGFVSIANQLSTQIGGSNVDNQVFTALIHNDKHTNRNTSSLFSLGAGIQQLNLDRVVVLTTGGTCSASEMVINALSPFIDVVTVGETTCGKPVGMNTQQICDDMVFAINFETVNGVGQGGYFNGIAAECFAQDNIVADWGSIEDPLLREGLFYINNNQCFSVARPASEATQKIPQQNKQRQIDYSKGPRAANNVY